MDNEKRQVAICGKMIKKRCRLLTDPLVSTFATCNEQNFGRGAEDGDSAADDAGSGRVFFAHFFAEN